METINFYNSTIMNSVPGTNRVEISQQRSEIATRWAPVGREVKSDNVGGREHLVNVVDGPVTLDELLTRENVHDLKFKPLTKILERLIEN